MIVGLSGIAKAYSEQVRVLEQVDLAVEAGDYLAVTGPSGSGKSTLLNIIGLLDRPSAGSLVFDGREVAAWSDRRRADLRSGSIGFVFQQPHLIPGRSALENVQLGLTYAPARFSSSEEQRLAGEALAQVGLAERVGHYSDQLSGGEAQRVAVARAIVKQPLLLLCDEPTGNLDEDNSGRLMDILERLLEAKVAEAVVVVTHDPLVAGRTRRQVALRHGTAVEVG